MYNALNYVIYNIKHISLIESEHIKFCILRKYAYVRTQNALLSEIAF